ncbi:MAG: hypothetical protein K2K86_02690, partial [Muribaculaceae bacterium]|nr:hypothetical protein [Muribaculaceae bacterium]
VPVAEVTDDTTFDITAEQASPSEMNVTIKPSSDKPYTVYLVPGSRIEGFIEDFQAVEVPVKDAEGNPVLDADGNPVQTFIDNDCEPSDWQEGTPYSYRFDIKPNVKAGEYTWGVAIIDTRSNEAPGIQLAVSRTPAPSGWVRLSTVKVN